MAQGQKLSAEDLAEWTANRATLAAAVAECDQVIEAHKAAVAEEEATKAAGGIEPETLKTIIKREETAGGKRHGTAAGILALREAGGKTAGSK
jgi:hypothetical protein